MELKFIVDYMCGRLAKWLRILGFDTKYIDKNNVSGAKILLQSLQEQRIILTRNTKLSNKKAFQLILIKYDKIFDQVKQVISELNIKIDEEKIFSRCCLCNEKLVEIKDKSYIKSLVPPYVYDTQEKFFSCLKCNKIYWQGSHHKLFLKDLNKIIN